MAEDKLKRISYQPKDLNEVKQVSELKAHEILLKYEDNDIVVTDENCEPHSLKEFINAKVKNLLSANHMKDNNQHNIVTEENAGFMSADTYKEVLEMKKSLENILNIIEANSNHNPFITDYFDYRLKDNTIIIDSLSVNNGVKNYSLSDEMVEVTGGINTYPKSSLIYLDITDDGFTLENEPTIFYSDTFITIGDNSYLYDNKLSIYTNGVRVIYPLLVITNNHKMLKDCDNILPTDVKDVSIYKFDNNAFCLGESYGLYELQTNLSKSLNDEVFLYVDMNGDDTDIKSGNGFGRLIKYKESPYGKMGYGTNMESDVISFDDKRELFLSFLIDADIIENESIIKITDDTFTNYLEVYFVPDHKCIGVKIINSDISAQSLTVVNTDKKYSTIGIHLTETNLVVLQDNTEINRHTITNNNKFNKIQLLNNKMPIGQILLADKIINDENVPSYTNINNENGQLIGSFDVLSDKNSFIKVEKNIGLYTTNSNILLSSLNNYNKLSKGDILRISLDDKAVPFYESDIEVISIENNIIYTNIQDWMKVGENITIFNSNFSEYYHANIEYVGTNHIIINKVISKNIIGFSIANSKDCKYIKVSIDDDIVNNIVQIDDYNFDIYIDRDHELTSMVNIVSYKKINNYYDFNLIKDIAEVTVDDNMTNCLSEFKKEYGLADLNCKYNGEVVDGSIFERKEFISFSNSKKVTLELSFNINDTLLFNKVDMDVVKDYLKISASGNIWTGSNPFTINGEEYRGNKQIATTIKLDNLVCDKNGLVTITFETETGQFNSKIIIYDFNVSLFFKDMRKIFFNKDGFSRMNNIVVYGKDYILSDVTKKLSMVTVRGYDDEMTYYDQSKVKIIGEYNDMLIVVDCNNLVRLAEYTGIVGEDSLQKLACYELNKKFIK